MRAVILTPPTWVVLPLFHLRWDYPVLPLAFCGALGAVTRRGLLAPLTRPFGTRVIPSRWQQHIETLVERVRAHRGASWLSLGLFMLGPVPTDHLFIAAGIGRTPLPPPLAIFGVSRLISYLIWISVAQTTNDSIGTLLRPSFGGGVALAAQILGFILPLALADRLWASCVARTRRRPRSNRPRPLLDD